MRGCWKNCRTWDFWRPRMRRALKAKMPNTKANYTSSPRSCWLLFSNCTTIAIIEVREENEKNPVRLLLLVSIHRKMEEPLLGESREEETKWVITRGAFVEELKKLSFLSAPMVGVAVSQYLLPAVSLMMAGHLGELTLASVAIATSFTNVTGIIPLVIYTFLIPLFLFLQTLLSFHMCISLPPCNTN